MSMWRKLWPFGVGEQKQSEAYAVLAHHVQGRPVFTPQEYDKLAKEGYNKNAIAYRCVNMIAASVKSVDVLLYKKAKSKRGKVTEVENHPVLQVLSKPNPLMSGTKYWEHLAAFIQLSGNSYTHGVGSEKGKPPRELWPLRPDTVKVIPGQYAMPQGYEVSAMGKTLTLSVDPFGAPGQMLHYKTFNPIDPWYGMSPIEAAAFSIDQHNESGKWNVGLLQNSARPSGAFIFKQSMQPEKRKEVERQLTDKYTGSRNAGKPLVLEGEVDYKGFSFSPKDMEWIESKQTSARDIALAFGVPPQLLGIPGDNTYSNYQEARQAFWIETVLPLTRDILDAHTCWLLPLYGAEGMYLGFNKDELDALSPSRDALWTRVNGAGHLTTNEKRVAIGYEEKEEPEHDQVLVSSSMVPLVLEEEPEAEITPAALADENGLDPAEPEADPEDDEDEPEEGAKGWEHKVFNIPDAKSRARTWTTAQRKRRNFERRFAAQLKALFQAEGARVAEVVDGLNKEAALIAAREEIDNGKEHFLRVIRANLKAVGVEFGEATLRNAKSSGLKMEVKDNHTNIKFESFLNQWIEMYTARRVTLASQSTKRKIAKAIEKGFELEEGIPQIAERIKATYKGFSDSRATLIARTEIVAASNAGALGAAKALGMPMQKEWVSSNDDRSRNGEDGETTNHRKMDGVKVDIDDKFEVESHDGVDLMEGPGDPDAPVDQLANCRCTLAFVQKGE